MLTIGIVLFIIGVLVMVFASGEAERLGRIVAVIGIIVIVLALALALIDDDDVRLDAVIPAFGLLNYKRLLR